MRYNGSELTLLVAKDLLQAERWAVTGKESTVLSELINQDNSDIVSGGDLARKLRTALLFTAIRNCDPDEVVTQLVSGADINGRNARNQTPVIFACRAGDAAVLGVLLANEPKPDLTLRDTMGWTALHEAAYQHQEALVRMLVQAGASLDLQAVDGRTPLAVVASQSDREQPAKFLYEQVRAGGRDLTLPEIEFMRSRLYGNAITEAKSLLGESFLQVAGADIKIADLNGVADQLRGHIGELYDKTAAAAVDGLKTANLSPAGEDTIRFAVEDLKRLKLIALAELQPNPGEVIRLIGHQSHASCMVQVGTSTISTGGWSPAQALWHQCLALADAMRRSSLGGAEQAYLAAELALMSEALVRAEELVLVENLLIEAGTLDTVAPKLASRYAQKATASEITLLPCGSRSHATYITMTPQDKGQRFELAMHNLGRLVNVYHQQPSPHQYLPYVTVLDGKDLPAVIEMMIKAYVTFGNLDTRSQLGPVYDQLKLGKPVPVGPPGGRFRPVLRQVANNCSLANLQSVRICYGLSKLPDSWKTLRDRVDILEQAYADELWATVGGHVAVNPPITVLRAQGQLYRAAYLGDEQACDTILRQAPACINLIDEDRQTVLHLAAQTGFPPIARVMLRYNTGTSVKDRHGKLPIEYVVKQPELLKILSTGLKQGTFKVSMLYSLFSTQTFSFYSDEGMSPGALITELDADTEFIPLENAGNASMKIAVFTNSGTVRIGYVKAADIGTGDESI
jgi:ankyrin repeat protein